MNNESPNQILIVEDEIELRELLVFDFESAGYSVLEAQNATEAFAILEGRKIDAVVSDIRMANGDGVQLLNSVQKKILEKDLILVLITGFSDFSIEDALNLGADGFLLKPFGRRVLVDAIERLLVPIDSRWSQKALKKAPTKTVDLRLKFPNLEGAMTQKKFLLGRGGMFLASTDGKLNANDTVQFEIQFEGMESFRGQGTIRWIRRQDSKQGPAGFGLEFLILEDFALKHIKEINEKHQTLAYIPKAS